MAISRCAKHNGRWSLYETFHSQYDNIPIDNKRVIITKVISFVMSLTSAVWNKAFTIKHQSIKKIKIIKIFKGRHQWFQKIDKHACMVYSQQ